ncbi:hypothetical protein HYH02_012598 [Chlamydomonas schloesseri]|uniref:Uncharacterized protein n=1 Tax=Chlamydomonas schloesseri TaxID=2026947 RepID=A0A835VZC3_9CHLO|nr:hypothetical protein HYH02_012598 [Chlamydomonas schloesseri]|eukprot:KAG2433480.1 hypothetical protein HYH02_012598 [Chlamydomonas schloesseri]
MSLAATQRSSGAHLDGSALHNGAWFASPAASVASSAVLVASSSSFSAHGCNGLPLPGLSCGSPTLLQGAPVRNPVDSATATGAPPSHATSVSSCEAFLMTDVDGGGARPNSLGRSTGTSRGKEPAPAPDAAEPAALLSTATAQSALACNISNRSGACIISIDPSTSSSIHDAITRDARPRTTALPPAGPALGEGGSDSRSRESQQGCSDAECATMFPSTTSTLQGCNAPTASGSFTPAQPALLTEPAPLPLPVPGWVASQPLAIAAAACGRGGLTTVDSPSYATTSEIQIQPLASGSSVEGAPAPELLRPRPRPHRTSAPSAVVSGSAGATVPSSLSPVGRCEVAPPATAASSGASSAAVSTSGAAAGAASTPSGVPPDFARRSSGGTSNGGRGGSGGMGAGGIYRNGVLRGAMGATAPFPADPAAAAAMQGGAVAAGGAAALMRHQGASRPSLPSPGACPSPSLLSPPSESRTTSTAGGGGGGGRTQTVVAGSGAGTTRRGTVGGNAKTSQITHQFSSAQRRRAAVVIQAAWRGFRIRRLYLRLIVWRLRDLQAAAAVAAAAASGISSGVEPAANEGAGGAAGSSSSSSTAAATTTAASVRRRGYLVFARRRFLAPVPPELPELSNFTNCGRPPRLIGLQRRVWFQMGEPPRAAAPAAAAAAAAARAAVAPGGTAAAGPAPKPPALRVRVPRRAEVDVMMSEVERILAGGFWRDGGCALSSAAPSEAGSEAGQQGLSMYMQARLRQEEREAEEALQMLSFEPAPDLLHKLGSLKERTLGRLGSLGRSLGGALLAGFGAARQGHGHAQGHGPEGAGLDAEAGGGAGGVGLVGLARSLPRVFHAAAAAAASRGTHMFGSLPHHTHHTQLQRPTYLPLVPQPGLLHLHPSPLHQPLLAGYGTSGVGASGGAGLGVAGSSVGSSFSSVGGGWLAGLGSIAAAAGSVANTAAGGPLADLESAAWDLRMPLLSALDGQGNAQQQQQQQLMETQLSAAPVPLAINRQRYRDRCHVSRRSMS